VSQRVAVRCSVMHDVAVCAAVFCSVLPCVAVCCSVLQSITRENTAVGGNRCWRLARYLCRRDLFDQTMRKNGSV